MLTFSIMTPINRFRAGFIMVQFMACLTAMAGDAIPHTWSGVERIVAVGDIHGDCKQLVSVLRLAKVVDQANHWIGGKTHLVQTGDIFDRGPESKKAMDLLMDLEPQASAAGGMVHALIGNHEAMVLGGNRRDTHPGETESYGGTEAMAQALGPDGKYGSWIRHHNAVIKINDVLFLHAGLSPKFASVSLAELNDQVRAGLKGTKTSGLAADTSGPLWYRGLAMNPEPQAVKELDVLTKEQGVNRVVIGHTVSPDGISCRANSRVIMIDVGMTQAFGGTAACLVIEGNRASALTATGQTALPAAGSATAPNKPATSAVR